MSKGRPAISGYARIAQAEEEEDEDAYHNGDNPFQDPPVLSKPGTTFSSIQPRRQRSNMNGSEPGTPERKRPHRTRHMRSNSGVDIKAINARLERWAEEIAAKFKRRKQSREVEEELEIQHSVFQAPDWIQPATQEELASYEPADGTRVSKVEFDDAVESVRVAIELGTHPTLISQGSSGSYFARNGDGKVVGVFKPKDEEPYASRNPKWTKWIHRNLFPFFFGRACLIPNLSYVSEAAAYVLDCQLRTDIVPYTDIVALSSKSFFYDYWDRRAFYRKRKPFPEKVGSFQYFLKGYKDATQFLKENPWPDQANRDLTDGRRKKKRRWAEDCRPGRRGSTGDANGDATRPQTASPGLPAGFSWTPDLQQSFREELEKLVILDYIMRNTDRGLDNWMIKVDQASQTARIVVEPPSFAPSPDLSSAANGHVTSEADAYKRQQPMTMASPSMGSGRAGLVSLGAIDNSLSWPWKHPDAWRSYPFGWLFLPVSLIGQPFSTKTREHFLPLLTSKSWWTETQIALRRCFTQDADFQEKMYAKQIAVMKGQAWNVVEALKAPDHGPLELTRRTRVYVWDDVVEVPVAVPLKVPGSVTQRRSQEQHRNRVPQQSEHEEMDISAARSADTKSSQQAEDQSKRVSQDLLGSPSLNGNRFNISRHGSDSGDREDGTNDTPSMQEITWSASTEQTSAAAGRGQYRSARSSSYKGRMSYDAPRSNYFPRRQSAEHKRRRFSFSSRGGTALNAAFGFAGDDDDEDVLEDGDLGFSAAEDMEGSRKKVIVERLEAVKSKQPFFEWC